MMMFTGIRVRVVVLYATFNNISVIWYHISYDHDHDGSFLLMMMITGISNVV